MVLIDTSVWSLAFRRRRQDQLSPDERATIRVVHRLAITGEAKIIGPIRQELLTGIREQSHFERLRDELRSFPDEPLSEFDFEMAAEFSNRCMRKGVAGSAEDLLICAVSAERAWSILTLDRDFARYATVVPIQLHPTA